MQINLPWSVNNISTNRLLSVLAHTTSGGVTINDIMVHAGTPSTPFGGIGNSGHGSYHGRYGFDTFTHLRTVVNIPSWFEYLVGFRYPQWDKKHINKISSRNEPGFKRGEGMVDQTVGRMVVGKWVGRGLKWGILVVLLGLLDAKMGGGSKDCRGAWRVGKGGEREVDKAVNVSYIGSLLLGNSEDLRILLAQCNQLTLSSRQSLSLAKASAPSCRSGTTGRLPPTSWW